MGLKKLAIIAANAALMANAAGAAMFITEWQYNGSEYVEFTNLGQSSIDMTGWSFDDSSRTAGSFSLSDFGVVAPNESVLLAEVAADAFKTRWNLGPAVKVIGLNSNNLGRADEINLFDNLGNLIDRLTYDDETIPPPAGVSIRTQNISGNPISSSVLGINDVTQWVLSVPGDRYGSYNSTDPTPFVGNPGINIVPEPATVAILGIAAALAASWYRRKR